MYILYAAPLSLFVMLLPQANTAPGRLCIIYHFIAICFVLNPTIFSVQNCHVITITLFSVYFPIMHKNISVRNNTIPVEVWCSLGFLWLPSSSDSPGVKPSTTWKLLPCLPHTWWICIAASRSAARSRSCWARWALSCLISNWRWLSCMSVCV